MNRKVRNSQIINFSPILTQKENSEAEVFYYVRQLCKRQLFSQKFNC